MKFFKYLKDVKNESLKVRWPKNKAVFYLSLGVVFVTLIAASYLGFFDYIFSEVVKKYLIK